MSETQQTTLKKQLSSRHITMLALGGAIGAGLFKGSGEAIGIAGPSVLIAFLIGGAVLFIVMSGLGNQSCKKEAAATASAIILIVHME